MQSAAKTKKETLKADFALLLAVLIWGTSFVMVKDLLKILSPAWAVGLRFLMALPLFLGCMVATRSLGRLKDTWKSGLLLGIPLAMVFESQTIGMLTTTASNSAFITGMSVVFTPLAGWLLLKKKPFGTDAILVIVALTGMGCLTLDFSKGGVEPPTTGDLLTLITALGQAFHIVLTHRYVRGGANPFALLFWQFLVVALVSLGSAPLFGNGLGDLGALGLGGWSMMVYLAIFPAFLTYLVQTVAQTLVEPMHLALIYSLEPVFASLFSVYFMLEVFGPLRLLGAGLLLFTCVLSEVMSLQRNRKALV